MVNAASSGTRPHPWNRAFRWSLPATTPTTISPNERSAFDEDGFLVLPELIDPSTIATLTDQLDELEADVDRFLAQQPDGRVHIAETGAITFTVHAVLRSAAARAFVKHPALVGLCHDLVGPDVNLYWDQAVYKKPEKPRRFPWHQDTGYTYVEPQHYLTCWVALTDVTVANGSPWVVPGVHRGGTLLHHWVDPIGWECLGADPDGAVAAEVPAGGAVVFSSLTPHLTGPNTTGAVRKAYIVQYAPVGLRRIEGDWLHGSAPTGSAPCDDPDRQFAVLRDAVPV
ncbi:MAG TPA: phytanoyl-CoA dioxygenase family protein [Acidimicrobiia bacterium]|nr:phytanoyl-CoA dioxygenase family protein [Acidimicrobiia bacterium]